MNRKSILSILSIRRAPALLTVLLALGACDGGVVEGPTPRGPVPGTVELTLSGATTADEAVLVAIGPGATDVRSARTELEVRTRAATDGYVVAVFGPLAGGPVLRLSVSDVESLPTLTVRDVTGGDGSLRADLSGYALRPVRP